MQLTRKLLDGIHQTRRRAIDGVANDGEPIFLSGFQIAPAGLLAKRGEVTQNAIGVRIRKDDVIGLLADDFFETDVRPILLRMNHGLGARETQGIGKKVIPANGDERGGPHDEKHARRSHAFEFAAEIVETRLQRGDDGFALFFGVNHGGKAADGSQHVRNGARVRGVGGYVEALERVHRFTAIARLGGDDHQIGPHGDHLLEIGVDDAADFGFLFRFRRVVAVVGVRDEAILRAQSVNGFGDAGGQRNDATHRLGHFDLATNVVGDGGGGVRVLRGLGLLFCGGGLGTTPEAKCK